MAPAASSRRIYRTPGVYLRPQPPPAPDIRPVRTDIAGFIGFAERGPLPSPSAAGTVDPATIATRLTSWKEYQTVFGGFTPYGYLAYAVKGFFDNGGTTCWVVRAAATHDSEPARRPHSASIALPSAAPAVMVGRLAAQADADATQLAVNLTGDLRDGDLIAIRDDSHEPPPAVDFAMVEAADPDGKVLLGRKLRASHSAGEAVMRYAPALVVTATSMGNWGNRVRLDLSPLESGDAIGQFALRVSVDPVSAAGAVREEEFYKRLSLDPNSPNYAPSLVNPNSLLVRLEAKAAALLVKGGPAVSPPPYLQGGRDGLNAITLTDLTGGLTDDPADMRGLKLLEKIDEVAILCAPDAVFAAPAALPKPSPPPRDPCAPPPDPAPPQPAADDPTAIPPAIDSLAVARTMIDQCSRLRYRVAIIDPPGGYNLGQVAAWRNNFATRFAAAYYPWLKVADPLEVYGPTRSAPPSGWVAGIYARIDNSAGVQNPPANAALEGVADVVLTVSAEQQENLNPYGINVIRPFRGRGIRIWGARSLARPADTDWKYIHVRRLMSMIEKSVEHSTQWVVFKPNDFALRRTVTHSLSVFLGSIWRKGGLRGVLPAQSFFVRCDESNNPPQVVDAGQLVCQVGVAIAAPMEFLVFEIHQADGAVTVSGQ